MRWIHTPMFWMLAAYVGLSIAFGTYVHHVEGRQDRIDERVCTLLAFTRSTQSDALLIFKTHLELEEKTAGHPALRALLRQQQAALDILVRRSSPPTCDFREGE